MCLRGPSCVMCVCPPIWAEASTRLSFGVFLQVPHRFVDHGDACAFPDAVPDADDSRCPRVVALDYRRGDKRDQRVYEGELVMELTDACEALTHECDRRIGIPAPHCQDSANIQRPGQEPRTRLAEHGGALIEQQFPLPSL